MCVLAAVMDAVDAGYRVILAEDALCSVSDESHDAMLRQFGARFSQQIEVAAGRGDPRRLARAVNGARAITCACARALQARPA